MKLPPLGPFQPIGATQGLQPGTLYREAGPFDGQVRLFTIDLSGARCFEITVRVEAVTPALLNRWADDARAVAGVPHLSLIR